MVQFYPWFKFYFLLCLGIVMYDNEFETRKIQFEPRIKLNHNMYIIQQTGNENIHTYQVEVMILIQP